MIQTDERGETHFGVQDVPERELAVGPPPNPLGQMSDLGAVTTMSVISFRAGTEAPAHNAPQPYVCIILSGEGEVVTSDGEVRRFHPCELLLCNDLTGETIGHRLTAFDIQEDGSLANRRVWAQLPTSVGPDGICLDAEGCVWCANPEGEDSVVRVRKGGEITDRIRVDTHAYAVMLGGPERRHLFICASGSHDPAEIQRKPSACFQVVEVDVPGAGIP